MKTEFSLRSWLIALAVILFLILASSPTPPPATEGGSTEVHLGSVEVHRASTELPFNNTLTQI